MDLRIKEFLTSRWMEEHEWENEGDYFFTRVRGFRMEQMRLTITWNGIAFSYRKGEEFVELQVSFGYVDQVLYTIMGHCA